jgi:hypothetical protein
MGSKRKAAILARRRQFASILYTLLVLLLPLRHRQVSCYSAPRASRTPSLGLSAAAAAAAASWDGGRDLVGRRSCSRAEYYRRRAHDEGRIRSLSKVRVHLEHPRAHALIQTARHSIAPLTLGFQTRNDKKIKSIEVVHIYVYCALAVTLELV